MSSRSPRTVSVRLNGEVRELPPGTTVDALVHQLSAGARGVAVAVNATVVPRTGWSGTVLHGGESVEILTATQGG